MEVSTRQAAADVRGFSADEVASWKKRVADQRDILFRRGWKNHRSKLRLRSREELEAFDFVVEWYEEFGEVVGKEKEKKYFDELIAAGVDVNEALADAER